MTGTSTKVRRSARRSRATLEGWNWQDAARSRAAATGRSTETLRFPFDQVVGPWFGGIVLGTAGCVLGAYMPYRHPVGVTISVLWWGIYAGCFGIWGGSALGALAERVRALLSEGSSA